MFLTALLNIFIKQVVHTMCNRPYFGFFFSHDSGQGTGDGKKALYHCNYCNKDITGRIRIKCAMCPDFDLCIECFSVGVDMKPHKSDHDYRVMVRQVFHLQLSLSSSILNYVVTI